MGSSAKKKKKITHAVSGSPNLIVNLLLIVHNYVECHLHKPHTMMSTNYMGKNLQTSLSAISKPHSCLS